MNDEFVRFGGFPRGRCGPKVVERVVLKASCSITLRLKMKDTRLFFVSGEVQYNLGGFVCISTIFIVFLLNKKLVEERFNN